MSADGKEDVLSWKQRIGMAIDVAKGQIVIRQMEKFSVPLVAFHRLFVQTNNSSICIVGLEYLHDGCMPP